MSLNSSKEEKERKEKAAPISSMAFLMSKFLGNPKVSYSAIQATKHETSNEEVKTTHGQTTSS